MAEVVNDGAVSRTEWDMPKGVYYAPLVVGFAAVAWGLLPGGWNLPLTPLQAKSFSDGGMPPFYILTYLLLFGSTLTVVLGTSIYLFDELFVAEHKFPRGHGGRRMRWAFILCLLTVFSMLIFLGYGLFSVPNQSAPADAVDKFKYFVWSHDILTFGVFLTFLIIDCLSLSAARKAETFSPPTNSEDYGDKVKKYINRRALHMKKLSYAQIFLVDIAVLLGSGANFGIHFVVKNSTNLFTPASNMYVDGVTAGFLAAHVIVSQIVFIALNVKGKELFGLE
jgi:hypothetical protein